MLSKASTLGRARLALYALLLSCSCFLSQATAQTRVENYKVESGSEFDWDYWQGSYYGWGYDDLFYYNLPFDFVYDGITYPAGSTMYVSTNGWVTFNEKPDYYDFGYLGDPNYPNTIYALGMDLNLYGSMYIWAKGKGDDQQVIFTWEYAVDNYYGWYYNYFQIKLNKKDNSIEMSYDGNCWEMHPWGGSVAVGLNGNNGKEGFSSYTYSMASYAPCEDLKFRGPIGDKPALSIGSSQLNFSPLALGTAQTLCVSVSNTGTPAEPGGPIVPLTFNPASITGLPAEFKIVSSPTVSLLIGESAQYCVEFKPTQPNTRTATLNISSSAGNGAVALQGRGVAPAMRIDQQVMFRKTRTKVAHHREESFYVYSVGAAPLTVQSAVIGGDYPEQYSVVEMPTKPIPVGDSGKVTIRFSPRYEGLKTGTVTVTTNGFGTNTKTIQLFGTGILPKLTVTPNQIGTDSVGMGDTAWYTVRLENIGSDTVNIKRNYLTSGDRDFTFYPLSGMDTMIPPEKFRDVLVRFTPLSRGFRQARIRVISDIPLTYEAKPRDTSTFDIDIRAIGVPYGLMSVEAASMYDSARIGTEICKPVKIWNNGQSPLTITAADINGSDSKDFEIKGVTLPLTIAPMSSVDAQICATPTERGLRTASLDVSATSNDRTTNSQLSLEVYGLAVCSTPDITAAFNDSVTKLSTGTMRTITVTNCGDVPADYIATATGNGYGMLVMGSPLSAIAINNVAPGATAMFEVGFRPTQMGLHPGTITITSEGVPDMIIDLAGTGGNSVLAATGTNVTSAGEPVDFDVTVTNTGNYPWSVGMPEVSGSEYMLKSSPATIAENGGTGVFTFTYTPVMGTNHQASVTFPNSDNTTFTFTLNGTVASVGSTASNGYELRQNYPNPMSANGTIAFTMAEAGFASIMLVDMTGSMLQQIASGYFAKGENSISFDASALASGTYFYQLTANGIRLTRALTLKK